MDGCLLLNARRANLRPNIANYEIVDNVFADQPGTASPCGSCQELPGCHSQGATVAEAMENIQDAIEGYLELYGQPDVRCQVRKMEIVTG